VTGTPICYKKRGIYKSMTYDQWKKVESEALEKWQGIIESVESSNAERSKRQNRCAAIGFVLGLPGMCVLCAIARVFAPQIASMAGYDLPLVLKELR
jgi:hypothetical protein